MHPLRFAAALGLAACALAIPAIAAAQDLKAITEDGRRVLLSPDGRWRLDPSPAALVPAPGLPQSPFQTAVRRYKVAYDTSKWTLTPAADEPGKRVFRHKTAPVFGLVIAEALPVSSDLVRNIMIYNARKASGQEPTVLIDRATEVQGKPVGFLRFVANLQGVDFLFTAHYHGSDDGNVQVACYTAQSLFHRYEAECQEFIAGLRVE